MKYLNRSGGEKPGESRRKTVLQMIPLALLLLFFLSSYLVFFLTGKNGDRPVKLASDTIVLTPEGGETSTAFHMGGRILYEDGTPFAGGTVELHSKARTTVTDEYGRFLFDQVESGEHELKAVDPQGRALAECRFLLSKNEMEEPLFFIEKGSGEYELQTNINLRLLEITAQIREDQVLVLQPDMSTLNHAGILMTPGGLHDIRDSLATVTPVGFVILPDGYIILPKEGYIQPNEIMIPLTGGGSVLPDGTEVDPDGNTRLPNGAVIEPDGTILLPDGSERPLVPEGNYLDEELEVYPIGDQNGAGKKPDGAGTADGGAETGESRENEEIDESTPALSEETEPSANGDGGNAGKDNGQGGNEGEGDGETLPPVDSAPLRGYQGNESWQNLAHINLFGQRANESEPIEIHPGSQGSYTFKLRNGNSYSLIASITMSDKQNEAYRLGFLYRLKDTQKGTWLAGNQDTWLTPEAFASVPFEIKAKQTMEYTLEWYWPYERASASIAGEAAPASGDRMDTIAGIADGEYYLDLTVNAELVY